MPNVCIAKIMYTNSIKNLLTFFQMYFLALHIRIWVRTYDVCKCQNKMWLLHLKVTNVAVNHHDYNISLKNVTNTYFPRVKYMHSTHYSTPMYSNFNWPKFFQQTKYQMMCTYLLHCTTSTMNTRDSILVCKYKTNFSD